MIPGGSSLWLADGMWWVQVVMLEKFKSALLLHWNSTQDRSEMKSSCGQSFEWYTWPSSRCRRAKFWIPVYNLYSWHGYIHGSIVLEKPAFTWSSHIIRDKGLHMNANAAKVAPGYFQCGISTNQKNLCWTLNMAPFLKKQNNHLVASWVNSSA